MADAPLAPTAFEDAERRGRPLVGYVYVLAAACLWGFNAVPAKVAIESGGLSAMRLSELRIAGAALIFVAGVALLRPRTLRVGLRELAYLAVFGVLGLALVQFFFFAAIARLDIGAALVIQYVAPVIVALWARFVFREPVRRRVFVALVLSLVGLSLVVELWTGVRLDGLGMAAAFGAAVTYAVYILMADGSLKRGRDVYSLLAWGFVFAALFWSVVQPWWTFPFELVAADAALLGRLDAISVPVWLLIAWVIVLGTVVPFIFMISALHHITPTRVALVAMIEPVVATVAAFAWLGEVLAGQQIAGGVVVVGAVALAQTARARARRG